MPLEGVHVVRLGHKFDVRVRVDVTQKYDVGLQEHDSMMITGIQVDPGEKVRIKMGSKFSKKNRTKVVFCRSRVGQK